MKNIVIICLTISTFIVGQDTTSSVNQEPQLPGWGVYVGGAFGGASSVDDLPDGHSFENRLFVPNIGISKGMFLGGIPLIAGVGIHPRGYTYELANPLTGEDVSSETQINMMDVWAVVPYPIGDRAVLQAGFLFGTCLGGTFESLEFTTTGVTKSEDDIEDIEGEIDYGIMLGGGFAITEKVGINVGYYIGLAEFDDMVKFNGLVFNLGYYF
ncbi:MAG: hypothetical protein CBE24_00495 [bacterium TMED264]|nr:MAG: hypothetical protein CBE24_00495 [bacterium TMED264]